MGKAIPMSPPQLRRWGLKCNLMLFLVKMLDKIDGLVQDCSNSSALAMELLQSCTKPIDGLVQDCSNSSALAMELLQSCTKPSEWYFQKYTAWRTANLKINCMDNCSFK